jgi:hypothetical protein
VHLGQPGPCERVIGLALDRLLEARARAFEIEVSLLGVGQGDPGRARLGVRLDSLLGDLERPIRLVLRHRDDGLEGEGVGVVRAQAQSALDVRPRLVDPADGQQQRGPVGEEARVGNGLGHIPDPVEGTLEIALRGSIERGPNRSRPVRSRRELVGTEVDDGRIVECPLYGIPGPRHDLRHRRLAAFGDGRLATGEGEAARRAVCHHCSLEDRQQGPILLHAHEELGAAHAGNGEGRLHVQAARATAEEVGGALEQPDHRGPLLLHGLDRDRRTGVEPEHRLVEQRHVGPAPFLDLDRVAGTERVVQLDRLPAGGLGPARLHGALHRDRARDLRLTRLSLG